MHTGKSYTLSQFLTWTRRDIYVLFVLRVVPVVAYQIGNLKWLGIPWTVVALLGTATAFIVGFKNLQTYNRVPDRGSGFTGHAWRNRLAAAIGTKEQHRTLALLQI
jgi:hypothetical protein